MLLAAVHAAAIVHTIICNFATAFFVAITIP
jgi:hypothetical protein